MSEIKMVSRTFKFRKTKDNGELGGTNQDYLVPEFNWDEFKRLPNAELFVRRAYNSQLQKLVRDILLEKNSTSKQHIQSTESVIARSLNFTKKEIEKWCELRDWTNIKFNVDSDKAIQHLTNILPKFAVGDDVIFTKEQKIRAAEIIATIADRKTDDIAEYLWVKLTEKSALDDLEDIDF